jgi:hypothetical protein
MKITRGFFNIYRVSDSNIINESFDRTRYFSANSIRSARGITVFISHKHSDLKNVGDENDLKGLLNYLEKTYNVIPYIDSMDKRMPKETCAETAERIKNVMDACDKFILLATNKALASKWCNWEVGVADKMKLYGQDMAILPMLDDNDTLYDGNEYLELYPYMELLADQFGRKSLCVSIKDGERRRWISLYDWLNDNY